MQRIAPRTTEIPKDPLSISLGKKRGAGLFARPSASPPLTEPENAHNVTGLRPVPLHRFAVDVPFCNTRQLLVHLVLFTQCLVEQTCSLFVS